jgi:hypothetical protein
MSLGIKIKGGIAGTLIATGLLLGLTAQAAPIACTAGGVVFGSTGAEWSLGPPAGPCLDAGTGSTDFLSTHASEGYVALASLGPNQTSSALSVTAPWWLLTKAGTWEVSKSILDSYNNLVLSLRAGNAWVAFLLEDLKGGWVTTKHLQNISLYGIATPAPVPLPAAAPLLAAALAGGGVLGWRKRRSRRAVPAA